MNVFKKRRILACKTRTQASEELGISYKSLGSYETGRTTPSEDMLPAFAKVYGCEVKDFIEAYE